MRHAPGHAALGGALLLGVLLAPASGRGTLEEARIQITVHGDTTWVIAWYRCTGTGDSLRLRATRPAGQTLVFQGVAGAAAFRLDTLGAGFRLVSRQADSAPALDVRYHVIGGPARVPLFVPDVATAGRSAVLIRVTGEARPARRAEPRFRPEPGDGWLARLRHVPAFVVLAGPP